MTVFEFLEGRRFFQDSYISLQIIITITSQMNIK